MKAEEVKQAVADGTATVAEADDEWTITCPWCGDVFRRAWIGSVIGCRNCGQDSEPRTVMVRAPRKVVAP